MKRNIFITIIVSLFCLGLTKPFLPIKKTSSPNIVLIYIDDLGYSDLATYGKTYGQNFIETPNIDRLAEQGLKFTNAYAPAPLCSPSRAAMLTGKSPARLGFEFVTKYENENFKWSDPKWRERFEKFPLVPPPFKLNLPLEEITIAEMLQQQNYHTAIAGKWHVSSHYKEYNGWNPAYGPSKQGFQWAANTFGAFNPKDKLEIIDNNEFPNDALTDSTIDYINKKHSQPFFMFLSHYYVHTPLDKRMKWLIDKYKKKANAGESEQRIVYAAYVETMDHYVGKVLDAIDKAGLRENTIVILTSDNGGHPEFAYNRPFRGSKWNLYEGGVRVPMIVRWPGIVKEGSISNSPVIQTDFMSTFYEISGGLGSNKPGTDGISILPLLKGLVSKEIEERSLVWHFPYYLPEGKGYEAAGDVIGIEDGLITKTIPQSSIRKGNLKYIYFYEKKSGELYNLAKDPGEKYDLSSKQTADAKKMKDALIKYLVKVKARFPQQNL
jgi:uncharacterized sulfatase